MHTALLYNKIMTNNNVFISSLVVGIAYVGYELLQPTYQGDGLGEIANGLGYIFIGIILIPIIYGDCWVCFLQRKTLRTGVYLVRYLSRGHVGTNVGWRCLE